MSDERWEDELTDAQWARLSPLMPGGCKGKRGPRTNNRRFMNAVVWMARSGSQWKYLPERYGRMGTVKQRYYDWVRRGIFQNIFNALNEDADFEWLSVDATIIRVHQHAAGARRQKGGLMSRLSVAPKAD